MFERVLLQSFRDFDVVLINDVPDDDSSLICLNFEWNCKKLSKERRRQSRSKDIMMRQDVFFDYN